MHTAIIAPGKASCTVLQRSARNYDRTPAAAGESRVLKSPQVLATRGDFFFSSGNDTRVRIAWRGDGGERGEKKKNESVYRRSGERPGGYSCRPPDPRRYAILTAAIAMIMNAGRVGVCLLDGLVNDRALNWLVNDVTTNSRPGPCRCTHVRVRHVA